MKRQERRITYSYLVRAWALEQMDRGILGRGAIAAACQVADRTVTSWTRSVSGRGPSLLATHREYIRAISILLYENFPSELEQVARMLRITPRMILEWRMQVRSFKYQSELIWATRLALVCLHYRIKDYFALRNGEIILLQGKYPDSSELEDMVFAVYDNILKRIVDYAGYAQCTRGLASFDRMLDDMGTVSPPSAGSELSAPVARRINGAHRYRGATICKDGYVEFSNYYQSKRKMYEEIPRNLSWLARSELLHVSEAPLDFYFSYLSEDKIRYKRYRIRYDNRWIKWNTYDALVNYVITVDPRFRHIKVGQKIP